MPLTFLDLPDELLSRVLGNTSSEDLGRTTQVNRRLHALADDNIQWNPKLKKAHRTIIQFQAKRDFLCNPDQRLEKYLKDDVFGRRYAAFQRVLNNTSNDAISKIIRGETPPELADKLDAIDEQIASANLDPRTIRILQSDTIRTLIAMNQISFDEARVLDIECLKLLETPVIRTLILFGSLTARQLIDLNYFDSQILLIVYQVQTNKAIQDKLIMGQLIFWQLTQGNQISLFLFGEKSVWSLIENGFVTIEQILQLENTKENKMLTCIVLCCIANGQLTPSQVLEINSDQNKKQIFKLETIQLLIAEGKLTIDRACEFAAPLAERVSLMIQAQQPLGDNYPWIHELPEVQALIDEETISLSQVHEIINAIEETSRQGIPQDTIAPSGP